jgi:hypothetical protein
MKKETNNRKREKKMGNKDQMVLDILDTAMYGITYWAVGDWFDKNHPAWEDEKWQVMIFDFIEEKQHLIDADVILEGAKAVQKSDAPSGSMVGQVCRWMKVLGDDWDDPDEEFACWADTEVADILVQFGLFGAAVYG